MRQISVICGHEGRETKRLGKFRIAEARKCAMMRRDNSTSAARTAGARGREVLETCVYFGYMMA